MGEGNRRTLNQAEKGRKGGRSIPKPLKGGSGGDTPGHRRRNQGGWVRGGGREMGKGEGKKV